MTAPEPRVMALFCPDLYRSGLYRPDSYHPDSPAARAAAQLFEQVLSTVTGFCPRVEAVEPGLCAFAARGCADRGPAAAGSHRAPRPGRPAGGR